MYGPEFAADPHAAYRRMRAYGPVAPVELAPDTDAMLVTSYQAALEVLRSPERFVRDPRRWKALAEGRIGYDNPVVPMLHYRPNALFADGPEHQRLRRVINDGLARVDPNALRGYVERIADTLIDRFAGDGEAELLSAYARVVPLMVFDQLFGCPPALGDRLMEGMSGIWDGVDAERKNALLTETLVELVTIKRRRPGADVTSWMLAHPERLTDEEMVHQGILLMGGGTEPQSNLIAGALRLLLSDDRFAGSLSGGSLPVEDALDEVLWLDPPAANYAAHYPVRDLDFHGVRLLAGEPVLISFAAGNTDPALASVRRAGNRAHLAWGVGPHACPARGPARLIASVAVEKLLDRLPDLELAVPVEELEWRPGPFHRALTALPVRFPPATTAAPPPARAAVSVPVSVSLPARDRIDESAGEPWNTTSARHRPPAPTSSTRPDTTSTPRPPASSRKGPRRPWSSLAAWWRGR
ncbi:cytochrome P450 [Streptomyces sp. B1866]|uniref:cytochrome P450 n=1 Tax=Streptomyces sp. B1866 TaxID=3075431 RepID=UPI002890EDFE|nr:cytochrome P450 [Streptomyces sp. B1866]MDT3395973.1 cytochrome P450 [Streptomyces sp. B1866]